MSAPRDAGAGGSPPGVAEKVAFLRRPEVYPDRSQRVEVRETHMSWVFLTRRLAYKLKKPVRWDWVDLSTLEARRANSEREVRLNRRLAGEVYRGTVRLTREADGGLALDGAGEPVDWLVCMGRLPEERMLDAAIERGTIDPNELRAAARHLARFYGRAAPLSLEPAAYRERLAEGMESDRSELLRPAYGLSKEAVEGVAAAQRERLERHAALFDRRVREGRIVEGHGDLRPEHILLAPEPVVIDCLEFRRELREVDPADELAFLGLECERLGAPDAGGVFLEVYVAETGDAPPAPLLRFYRDYRALRRAKIAVWHLDEPEVAEPEKWTARARRYLELASAADSEGARR